MPDLTTEEVNLMVQQQLEQINDLTARDALTALLVSPSCLDGKWDYGTPGETLPCWSVALHEKSKTLFVYSEYGFGLSSPWGIVFASTLEMGMDTSWFYTLESAFYESCV